MSIQRQRTSLRDAVKQSEGNSGDFQNLVFGKDVKVEFQTNKNALDFHVLPAIYVDENGVVDKGRYFPYRYTDFEFTEWVTLLIQHRNLGGKLTIIGTQTLFGPDALDPVELLWDTAREDPRFFPLICKDPVTKKFADDAYKRAILRRPEWKAAMNAIIPGSKDPELPKLLVVSRPAIFKFDYVGFASAYADSLETGHLEFEQKGVWGLADALDAIKDRNPFIGNPVDFESIFFQGDITNPQGMALCRIEQQTPPSGGIKTYNCTVTAKPRVAATQDQLLGRYDLFSEAFVNLEYADILDKVGAVAAETMPELAHKAWSNRGVDFDALLSRHGITSGAVTTPGARLGVGRQMPQQQAVSQAPVPQQIPVQQAPVQQAPVQQAPVQQAPAPQQAPVQQAPAPQQAPVQHPVQQPVQQPVQVSPEATAPPVAPQSAPPFDADPAPTEVLPSQAPPVRTSRSEQIRNAMKGGQPQ